MAQGCALFSKARVGGEQAYVIDAKLSMLEQGFIQLQPTCPHSTLQQSLHLLIFLCVSFLLNQNSSLVYCQPLLIPSARYLISVLHASLQCLIKGCLFSPTYVFRFTHNTPVPLKRLFRSCSVSANSPSTLSSGQPLTNPVISLDYIGEKILQSRTVLHHTNNQGCIS